MKVNVLLNKYEWKILLKLLACEEKIETFFCLLRIEYSYHRF